jgi:hypothetical protein
MKIFWNLIEAKAKIFSKRWEKAHKEKSEG